jgi:hypothetical protein
MVIYINQPFNIFLNCRPVFFLCYSPSNRASTGQLTRVLSINNIQKKQRHGDTSQVSASKALCSKRKGELFGPEKKKFESVGDFIFGVNGANAQQDEIEREKEMSAPFQSMCEWSAACRGQSRCRFQSLRLREQTRALRNDHLS